MAVSPTFKQQCPSCEAMISIKEERIGKKVECTKCKDKFIAERPEEEEEDEKPEAKNDAKAGSKKNASTSVSSKASAAGKKPKVDVEEEEEEEEEEKPSKSKAKTPANAAKEDEEDDGESAKKGGKKSKKDKTAAGSNKLVLGLGLAVVGVAILAVAAFFVMSGSTPSNKVIPQGKGTQAGTPEPTKDEKKPPVIDPKSTGPVAGELTSVELARLTNLLPNDTEHVFHVFFKDAFGKGSPLEEAAFLTSGALDPAAFTPQLGFSMLAIDDIIVAERFKAPAWKYTVIHFNQLIQEDQLKTALKLEATKIEGQPCYKTTKGKTNPYFDQLARFSFGVANHLRYHSTPREGETYFRVHNSQTLIVGDEAPVTALLAAKGQFPPHAQKSARFANPGGNLLAKADEPVRESLPPAPEFVSFVEAQTSTGKDSTQEKLALAPWEGTEDGTSKLRFVFDGKSGVVIDSPKTKVSNATGTYSVGGNGLHVNSPSTAPPLVYEITLDPTGKTLTGKAKTQNGTWTVKLQQVSGMPDPKDPKIIKIDPKDPKIDPKDPKDPKIDPKDPKVDPKPGTRDDTYVTIRKSLKDVLERMETRGLDGKSKILFSSATDMEANQIPPKSPDSVGTVARRPRQFWDVSTMLYERPASIRILGTALVQKDKDGLKFQLRNRLTCALDGEALKFHEMLIEVTSPKITESIHTWTGHKVQLPTPPKKDAVPPADDKKPLEPTSSQITVSQEANSVEFVLDLVLDGPTHEKVQAFAKVKAIAMRIDIEAALNPSLRHALANGAKLLGQKGLSERGIAPGQFPPGVFRRDAKTGFFADQEPGNRISWMAALLPHMGHENLFKKIQFGQSWRDPGNWAAGSTIVPEFLDPMYPDYSRHVTVSDLPIDFAATHYVGIAGVGKYAASYKRGDPATKHKIGALGYDESASLKEIDAGRGQASLILMLQVPHDDLVGVSPWIAGGGATLAGVPDKEDQNPLTPFLHKQTVNQQSKRGTYAVMADGSVRFIHEDMTPEVFKAMCTVHGPTPKDFDLTKDPNTLLIPAPTLIKAKDEPKKTPPVEKKVEDKEPIEKKPVEKEPEKKVGAADDAKALQGVWAATYLEINGNIGVAQQVQGIRYTFKGDKLLARISADREDEHTFTVDTGKSPQQIQWVKTTGPREPSLAIFDLKGTDELRLCVRFADSKLGRPTAFATQAGSDSLLLKFKRQTPK